MEPNKIELSTLTPSKMNGRGAGNQMTIPLTPTIRLSEPPTPHHVDYNERIKTDGIDNPAFVGDQEPLFSKSFVPRDNGIISTDEPIEDNNSVFSSSMDHSNSLNQLSTESSNHHSNGSTRSRHNTMSLSDMLMPPKFNKSQKRHSLPTNGVSTRGSNGQAISNENGSNSLLGSSCASIMSQVSSPMKGLSSPWRKWFHRKSSDGSVISSVSDGSLYSNSFDPDEYNTQSKQRLQDLVKSVARKVVKTKKNKVGPAGGSSPNTLAPPLAPVKPGANNRGAGNVRKRLDSFAPSSILDQNETARLRALSMKKLSWKSLKLRAIDPTGNFWIVWLLIVSLAFLYNAVVIFLRGIFSYTQGGNDTAPIMHGSTNVPAAWLVFDYICDLIYVIDMYLRANLSFFAAGKLVKDLALTRKKYFRSIHFLFDILCLLPLDLFYFVIGGVQPLLRFPRLLKFKVYTEFSSKFENKIRMAFIFRTVRMVGYLLYMIHLNTCAYYLMSRISDIGSTEWVYDGEGDPYIRCLYRATKTLITIGNLPTPTTTPEFIFMTVDFMIGVFVFATIIGQMRDIVGSASATRTNFRKRMDATMSILKNRKIPDSVQRRVHLWFMYSLNRGDLLDEQMVLQAMPIKMQTDMAIHVHMDTLSKVSLFQDCDKMLLRDLVLQLRPVLFLPGDYICKKGEVGKEMYIIKNGMVQVLGGDDGKKVLATLHAGSVFGEISLLSLGAGNRRTADVYSPGYSDLFVLDKKVLHEVIISYPDAQEILKKKAKEILKQNENNNGPKKKRRGKSLIAESILTKNPSNSPSKFFKAVLEVARSKHISTTILRGSFESKTDDDDGQFLHYSSSDISGDELIPFERRSFRRKRKDLNKHPSSDLNVGSGYDSRRSDGEGQEPTIVIHGSPDTAQITDGSYKKQFVHQLMKGARDDGGYKPVNTPVMQYDGGDDTASDSNEQDDKKATSLFRETKSQEHPAIENTNGRFKRKVGVAGLELRAAKLEPKPEGDLTYEDDEEDPGDFHFNHQSLRQSPNLIDRQFEENEEVKVDPKEGHFLPSLPKGTSILTAANEKAISFEEYKAVHTVYDIEDLDVACDDTSRDETRTTSQESLIKSEKKGKGKSPSPKKKYIKGKSTKGKKGK